MQGLLVGGWEGGGGPRGVWGQLWRVLKLMHDLSRSCRLQAPACSESRLALVREADSARKEQAELEVGGRRCLGWPQRGGFGEEEEGGGGERGGQDEGTYSFEDQMFFLAIFGSPPWSLKV